MDYKRTPAFWKEHKDTSGEELARLFGGDGGSWRRAKRTNVAPEQPLHRRGIAVFDLHHPVHDERLWANILRFAADFKPNAWVFGGDNQDMEVVSHWVGNKRLKVEGKRLKKDYLRFQSEILDPVDALLPDDAERIFLLGNHEGWVQQYIDEHPEMQGLIEIEEHLALDDWKVVPYGNTAEIGKLHFLHGIYCNKHHAAQTAQIYGRTVMYGHNHSLQIHTNVTPLDSHPHAGIQIPCACHTNPHYARNKPNAWVTGFAVFYVRPDGLFNVYPVVAIDGAFTAPDGTYYG